MLQNRQSNIELLRIIFAFSVIAYHLIAQSNALGEENSKYFVFSVFYSGGGRLACSVFVMIGAYFLVDAPFRVQRILRLWIKVILVNAVVNGIVLLMDPTSIMQYKLSTILVQFFPLLGKPHWFIADYIVLLIASPLLNSAIHSEKLQSFLKYLIFSGILFVSVLSFVPELFKKSIFACDFVWFCFLYILIGYMKRHFVLSWQSKRHIFAGIAACTYGLICILAVWFNEVKDIWPYAWELRFFYISAYQSIFAFVCSLSVFILFLNLKIPYSKAINYIGQHTLGVYIVHQVPVLYMDSWLWNKTLKINDHFNKPDFPLYCIFASFFVFFASCLINTVCEKIAELIFNAKMVQKCCQKINMCLEWI